MARAHVGYREKHMPSGTEQAGRLTEEGHRIAGVLDDVPAGDAVERAGGKSRVGQLAHAKVRRIEVLRFITTPFGFPTSEQTNGRICATAVFTVNDGMNGKSLLCEEFPDYKVHSGVELDESLRQRCTEFLYSLELLGISQ